MMLGQVVSNAVGATRSALQPGPEGTSQGTARNDPVMKVSGTPGVTVTLTPEARQHLSRLEGFAATIGTARQPKTMAKPGSNLDLKI